MKMFKRSYVALWVPLMLLTGCTGHMMDGTTGGWDHMRGYGYGGFVMWLIFIIFAAVILYLVLDRSKRNEMGRPEESSLDILKRRYAKGELSKEEFERMKKEIE